MVLEWIGTGSSADLEVKASEWRNGRYRGVELLGRGGSADVWRAVDQVLLREVAVKSFRTSTVADDAVRFHREVRLQAQLCHPHIIAIWDAGISDQQPWCVMELADGGSLAQTPSSSAGEDLAGIGAQLADALAYLHERGVVHRDLKPANILLGRDRHAYLADFGIARWADTVRLTQTGILIGTAAFLSPEQVRGEVITPASDIYALGLVLLEQLTGHREYPGGQVEAAIARLARAPVIPASMGSGWGRLLAEMTAFGPSRRPGAQAVRDALTAISDSDRGRVIDLLGPGPRPWTLLRVTGPDPSAPVTGWHGWSRRPDRPDTRWRRSPPSAWPVPASSAPSLLEPGRAKTQPSTGTSASPAR
jgi:serine/threonine protein kinase